MDTKVRVSATERNKRRIGKKGSQKSGCLLFTKSTFFLKSNPIDASLNVHQTPDQRATTTVVTSLGVIAIGFPPASWSRDFRSLISWFFPASSRARGCPVCPSGRAPRAADCTRSCHLCVGKKIGRCKRPWDPRRAL